MKKILLFSLLFLCCCGGGSSGTGSTDSQVVRGVLKDDKGQPIANATIKLIGSDLTAMTDSSGEFVFTAPGREEGYDLQIDQGEIVAIDTTQAEEINVEVIVSDGDVCGVSVDGEPIKRECENQICNNSDLNCPDGQFCDFVDGSCGQGEGVCKAVPEVCPELYGPVCGCDGKTYGNSCEAAGMKMSIMAQGECPIIN